MSFPIKIPEGFSLFYGWLVGCHCRSVLHTGVEEFYHFSLNHWIEQPGLKPGTICFRALPEPGAPFLSSWALFCPGLKLQIKCKRSTNPA